MIQVGLLSPALAVRIGLRALLEADDRIEVVAEAGNLAELRLSSATMEVLILANESLARQVLDPFSLEAWPDASVLLVGELSADTRSLTQMGLRAWGVLPQEASQEELLAAVHALSEGLIVAEPSMLVSLLESPLQLGERALEEPLETLTERELEVLQLLARGLANKQVALRLGISAHTVKFHISSIYGKLGATNRTEAVRIGLQTGLILL